MQGLGIDLKSVGLFSAIPTLFLTVGMIMSGRIINKVGSKAKYGVISGILITGASLYLMSSSSSVFHGYYVSVHCFYFHVICHEFCFTVPHRVMEQKVVGTAFGIINFGGQAAGIFSPMIMGALIASTGTYKAAFVFLTICCLVAAVIACFLPIVKKSQMQQIFNCRRRLIKSFKKRVRKNG